MCGIAGRINLSDMPVSKTEIQPMLDKIKHRGPDDEGIFIEKNIGLGHVRLSILDLSSAGHQPMLSNDADVILVFNGEIYNYLELKKELKGSYPFRTRTDTEVIIAAYLQWGEDCLEHFNGDWAFVLFDRRKKKIFGARDRYGIKPFYYKISKESFSFASEVKSLIDNSAAPNHRIIFDYLVYNRTDHTTETFFSDIFKLDHGSLFVIEDNNLRIEKWYNLKEKLLGSSLSLNDSKEKFIDLFSDSIALRLRSDVPVGVCLSGGLDSSAIVSFLLEKFNKKDINTFSAIYKGFANADESEFIDVYSDSLKNMHFTEPNSSTFYNDYRKFIDAQSEPVASIGPYAQFKVMELAKDFVKVTLDGQGADEELAGYHYFFGAYFKELLKNLRIIKFFTENYHYILNHKSFFAQKYFVFYLLPTFLKNFSGSTIYGNVSKSFFSEYSTNSQIGDELYNPRSLNESLYQHFEHKLEHLLKWEDHNSMYFSIESRVPFLDHRLVEFLLSIKSDFLINRGQTKYLLRESTKSILPEKIRNRADKKGFSTPSDEWLRDNSFKELVLNTINSASFKNRGIFDVESCNKDYHDHLLGKVNKTKDIWKWINLEIWFRNFID